MRLPASIAWRATRHVELSLVYAYFRPIAQRPDETCSPRRGPHPSSFETKSRQLNGVDRIVAGP